MTIETLQALLETAGIRADLAEGKVEALRMKVATSLEVIENLRDQIVLLEAELADVRELVPVDSVDEDDFLDEIISERTAVNEEFSSMVAKCQARRNAYGLGEE